jgi:hypothetical protein
MQSKHAFYILTALFILGVSGIFIAYSIKKEEPLLPVKTEKQALKAPEITVEVKEIVEKKNMGSKLTPEEQAILDKIMSDMISVKQEEINIKRGDARPYSDDELEYIANPDKAVKMDLGIKIATSTKIKKYTKEELEANSQGKYK